ncbi:MAG: glycosyltransferase family 4 protein [Thaumarchaeota archaeon]|nr:glycosyltransferase family 4 protein [Nitrososphaerota archaeon]
MRKNREIVIIYRELSTWVLKDIAILKEEYSIKPMNFTKLGNTAKSLLSVLKGVSDADLIYVWFAGDHSFWARIFSKTFSKPMILAVGGGDVTKIGFLNYGGLLSNPWRYYVTKSVKGSDLVLCPSYFTRNEIISNIGRKENLIVLYHGFDSRKFKPNDSKENLVVTVAIIDRITLFRKGLIHFVKAAGYLPNVKFYLVGRATDNSIYFLKSIASRNVTFTGYLPEKELIKTLQKAKVYVQASLHEGFGCSLAEAMLTECVPVVTKKGALPEVVGSYGFYVPYGDPKLLANAIRLAMDATDMGKKARDRVKALFSLEKRARALRTLIDTCR